MLGLCSWNMLLMYRWLVSWWVVHLSISMWGWVTHCLGIMWWWKSNSKWRMQLVPFLVFPILYQLQLWYMYTMWYWILTHWIRLPYIMWTDLWWFDSSGIRVMWWRQSNSIWWLWSLSIFLLRIMWKLHSRSLFILSIWISIKFR